MYSVYIEYRYRAPKNSSASAIWLAAVNIQKIHLFLFSKLAKYDLRMDEEWTMKKKGLKTINIEVSKCFHLISY